jgi:serine/threonine protein kinase
MARTVLYGFVDTGGFKPIAAAFSFALPVSMLMLVAPPPWEISTPRRASPSPSHALSRPRAVHAENTAPRSAAGAFNDVQGVTPLPIGARVGDFEVASLIHRGESGFVYLGTDRSSLTQIAVKEYLPSRLADRMADGIIGVRSVRFRPAFRDGVQGFLDQSRILADLDEPALVRIFRTWEQCGTAYTAMALYHGRSLGDTLRALPPPSEAWLKVMLGPLLDALAALHRSGCYPCDVTPDNVFVSDCGPLLFDVGIVRRILARSIQGRTVVRDRTHAAIEQYSSDMSMPEGPWTDIYAVASLLHLAITGNPPASPITRIVSDDMKPLSTVTNGYSKLFLDGVDRGLAVRPQHRPQSIEEFREALGIRSLESAAIAMREPTSFALPAPAPQTPEQGESSPPALEREPPRPGAREQGLPPPQEPGHGRQSQTTAQRRFGAPSKIVGASLIAVALIGFGLVWMFGGPEKHAGDAENATPMKALASEQSSSPESTSTVPAQTIALVAAVPPATTPASVASEASVASSGVPRAASSHSTAVTTKTAKSAPPAPKTGKIRFAIKPWGEILIDGRKRGVSPPIKELSIPEGRHRIEIRNSAFSRYASEVEIKAGRSVSIAHSFTSP